MSELEQLIESIRAAKDEKTITELTKACGKTLPDILKSVR